MHVAILRVVYSPRLLKTGGPLYLAFATPTCSGEITRKVLHYRASFLAYAIWVHKNPMSKTGLCGLKG